MDSEKLREGEQTHRYTWPVPPAIEGLIDGVVESLPENRREQVGRTIAYVFNVGFNRVNIDPNWHPAQQSVDTEQAAD